jgi:hypothetical protein
VIDDKGEITVQGYSVLEAGVSTVLITAASGDYKGQKGEVVSELVVDQVYKYKVYFY